MRTLLKACATSLVMLGMLGCATKSATIIDSQSDWLLIDKPAKVSVSATEDGKTWKHVGNVTVPAGMVIGPGPKK